MDGLKSDSETELTSTMGNALSVTNKDEKNDTNDATPTSSTDASTASIASRIVSDDPISSTSSDTIEQTKASEMNQSVTELLENIPSERITEDVEDLVHDLESLLGESTDSFSIPIRTPPEELKDGEDVVSQTSGELNGDQVEQPTVSCDEETHSEDNTLTLDTSSICDISAEISEELSGSSTKKETDITSSETCVENVEKCDDTNVRVISVPSQTSNVEKNSIEEEIQPAQDTQEIQVEKGNIDDSESAALSKICDGTEGGKVDLVSDSGHTANLDDMNKKEAGDKADQHVDNKEDEPNSRITESEGEEDLSSQTSTKIDDHLEEIKPNNEEEGNPAALDEEIAKQNIISTPEIERVDDLDHDLENKTSEVDNTGKLKEKEIVEDFDSMECVQKIPENSELSTDIPESTCFVEDPQKAVEVTQAIDEETNQKVVEDSINQDSKYSEDSSQPESPKKNVEQKEDEGVDSTTELTVPDLPVAKVSEIQNITVSEIHEVEPEISKVTMSSDIEETESKALPHEEIEPMIEDISSGIKPSLEVASKSMEVTEDTTGEDTTVPVATIDDIETVSTNPNLPETIESSNAETPECSVDINTPIASKSEGESQNMDSECAAPSLSEIADETTHDKDIKKVLVVVEEVHEETVKEVETEEECNEVEHTEDAENQPSICTEQESEETVEVAHVENSEEITDTGENIPENTESNDTKESANESLESIIRNRAENEEYTENKSAEICEEQVIVEESQTSESDDYKDLTESEIPSKETDILTTHAEAEAEPVTSGTAESNIPQNDETHQTEKNITQVEESLDRDTTVKETIGIIESKDEDHEFDLPQAEIICDESNTEVQEPITVDEKTPSILNNKEDMEVDEESVTCPEIFNNTERLKVETDDLSPGRPVIQEVECCQVVTITEKPEIDLKQLAESSGIVEESTTLPIENESTLKENDISFIEGNEVEETKEPEVQETKELEVEENKEAEVEETKEPEVEETKEPEVEETKEPEVEETKEPEVEETKEPEVKESEEPEVEKKVEMVSTEPVVSEVDEETLTQPDSTETIDTDEKITVGVIEGVVESDTEDSESSEDSVDIQKNDNLQATLITISDDDSSPAESDRTIDISKESFEKNPIITKRESKPSMMEQLEFAPLVLSEEDSEEEAVPTHVLERKENIAPHENIEENDEEEEEELPQIEEILENQPVYIESTASSVDMQENLETILAVASLQKIDIPKVTEPELLLSEKERREMEALRRAVESITDNSADAYVEEVQELINIPMLESNECDQNVGSEQPVFMEAETESILKSEDETIALQQEDESVPDESSNLIPVEEYPDTAQIELVDSSVTGYEVAENDQKIDDTASQKDEKNDGDSIDPNKDNLETQVKSDINFPQYIEQSSVDLNIPKNEQNVSTSMKVEAEVGSEEVNSTHDIDKSNIPSISTSEGKEIVIRDDIEDITGPKGNNLNTDNIVLGVDKLETDQNVEESNEAEAIQREDEKGESPTASDNSESQEREATQKVDEEDTTELVPDVVESQEREISHSMEVTKVSEIVPDVGESQEKGDTQTVDKIEAAATISEVGEFQEREITQTVAEMEITETVSEVGESQQREATEIMDKKKASETEVGEMPKREATQTMDEKEDTKTVPEVGEEEREASETVDEMEITETVSEVEELQQREATETMNKKTTTDTEVGEIPKRETIQTVDEKEDAKTVPAVEESKGREAPETVDEIEITETVSEVGESQQSELTETMDKKMTTYTKYGEISKEETIQTVDEKEDAKTIPEVGESQEREATETLDVTECTQTLPEEVEKSQKREAAHTMHEKKEYFKTVPEVEESQKRNVTQTMDKKESQEREAIQKKDEKTVILSEIGESQETEAAQKMCDKKGTKPDSEVVESQEIEATKEVNEEKGNETDSDVEESQERKASHKVSIGENTDVDPDIGMSQESEATQKDDQEEGTSTDPDNEESQEREASQKEDNETDPDIEEPEEREATQKVDVSKMPQRRTGLRNSLPEQETLIDSSQVITENEATPAPTREKEVKVKANERPKRHKKSDNKLEELSINVDVPDREKPYSPKITIKPIKVPDEEVSTTSNSEAEVTKGSLKMTITKQSDKLHSVLKVCDSENPESTTDMEEPIPKLVIKPKVLQTEQQHSPKMSTRSSNQRSLSPRITIKPVVKPEKQEAVSPLKIKIGLKSEETPKKHSSKSSARSSSKQEEDSPRKVLIKPVIKPAEENELIVSPRITIKPIPKPETEKDLVSRVNIKSIRKQDEENDEKERSSPKITIKPVVKPQETDSHPEDGEEVKERIVLKINKGNLPTPTKDSKKREHPPDDEKSEKLAKITVKFSKGGGHPHIVQQMEEVHKRPHDEPNVPEKNKKQKVDAESTMSTRSRHKEVAVEAPVETKSRHKEHAEGSDFKSKLKDTENHQFELTKSSKHKDLLQESPIEAKRIKLKDSVSDFPARQSRRSSSRSRQKDTDNVEDVQIVERKLNSPIVISEDSRSQDSGSVILIEDSKEELSLNLTAHGLDSPKGTPKSDSVVSTPSTTPTPRKRGRPRKVPIEVREEFKDQEEPPVKSKPKLQEEEESAQQSTQESGRPKRSCRGPSVCDRLGIKPRKPRGPGRGRGGKRGMGTRPIPMKPEKVPKLTKAKLKLMQKAAQDEAEAKKAFGKNPPPDSVQVVESSNDVTILETEDIKASTQETRKKQQKSKVDTAEVDTAEVDTAEVDTAESEDKTASTSETKNKSDISEPEDSKALETKKKIKSKVFKKLALQKTVGDKQKPIGDKKANVENSTDVKKDAPIVKNPQKAHSTKNNPQKSTDVQKKFPNLTKSLTETKHKQGDSTEANIVTEAASSNTEIEQNPPVIKEGSVVESSKPVLSDESLKPVLKDESLKTVLTDESLKPVLTDESLKTVLTDESVPVKTVADEKEERVTLKEKVSLPGDQVSLQGDQVSLELKKELLAAEDISLEVKAELILSSETPDSADIPLNAEENSISLEDVSFKLEEKDIDIETQSIELSKDAADVAVDVEDEIPYSILAPPGSASSKVFPGLAHGMPSSVQPLLATSQKSCNPEHSSVTSTSGPSEIVMVDEETRMSADTSSRAQTPAKQMVAPADMSIEESQSSVHSTATTESGKTPSSRPSKAPRLEVQEADSIVTAELISEYYWNGNGPFMIQEQVAQFLGIKSFKRKYPGIARRMVEMQERDFIREKGLASENMCDLGLTVVNSADILDIMYSDFQEKYEEYCKHQRDKQAKEMIDKQRAMNLAASQEKNKADITEQAVQSAAQWNARFNKTRKDQRRTCMDLQTLTVHYPKGRIKQINKVTTGNYPVALVPGQFTDFYEEFTPTEINNLPLNTMCYEPVTFIPREESEDSGSDGSESDSDSSDSSSSGSNSDSSSGVEDCKLCTKHSPKRAVTPK